MPLSPLFDVPTWFVYVNVTTYIEECVYMELIFEYQCYLIKAYMLDLQCIS